MAIGEAFLGGGVEVVPAGSCKLELEILTKDRANLTATFTIKGTSTYTVTAGADGRAVYTVPAGQTYTVSVNTTGYDNIASQTVIAESGTVRYVRFEAFSGRVKRSGDTMSGNLTISKIVPTIYLKNTNVDSSVTRTAYINIAERRYTDKNDVQMCGIRFDRDVNYTRYYLQLSENVEGVTKKARFDFTMNTDGTSGLYLPSSPISSENSKKVATTEWVNTASSVVHTTGNETIAGSKIFTGTFALKATNPNAIVKDTDGDSTVQPSSDQTNFYAQVQDKNGKAFCNLLSVVHRASDNAIISSFGNSGRTWSGGIRIITLPNGTEYADCPTTPSGATGKEIATANWSLGKFVQKSGDTMSGSLQITADNNISYRIKRDDLDRNVVPSYPASGDSDVQTLMIVLDKNNSSVAYIERSVRAEGTILSHVINQTANGSIRNHQMNQVIGTDGSLYVTIPSWSPGTNDNSDKVLTIKMANSLPSLVHTIGNETIAGAKTFKNDVTLNTEGFVPISIKSAKIDSTVSDSFENQIVFRDKNNVIMGRFGVTNYDIKSVGITTNWNNAWHFLTLNKSTNGTVYAIAPTTPSGATGTEIATANWSLSKFQRKITYGTGDPPSGGQAGDIYIQI